MVIRQKLFMTNEISLDRLKGVELLKLWFQHHVLMQCADPLHKFLYLQYFLG